MADLLSQWIQGLKGRLEKVEGSLDTLPEGERAKQEAVLARLRAELAQIEALLKKRQ